MSRSRTLVATAVLVVGLATPGSAALAADDPETAPTGSTAGAPVTQPDRVTVAADGFVDADVLANDRDPDDPTGRSLVPCRIEPSPGVPVSVAPTTMPDEDDPEGPSRSGLWIIGGGKPGTYTVDYGVCDYDFVTASTLTVVVTGRRDPDAAVVRKRPGFVRFSNPGPRRARFRFGSRDGSTIDHRFTLAPRSARTFRVERRSIQWEATYRSGDGSTTYGGILFGIRQPTDRAEARSGAAAHARPAAGRSAQWLATAERPAGAPVTADDTAEVSRGYFATVDVLANDSDPDGPADDLAICRAQAPAASGLEVQPLPGSGSHALVVAGRDTASRAGEQAEWSLLVAAGRRTRPGTYPVTYHACDRQYLTAGTVQVTVTPSQAVTARKPRSRPSFVRFTNPGPRTATIRVRDFTGDDASLLRRPLLAKLRLPAGATRLFRPGVRRIFWVAGGRRVPPAGGVIGGIGRR